MTSGWASAIIAGLGAVCALYVYVRRAGRQEGRTIEILDRLVKLTDRHDQDIRELQRRALDAPVSPAPNGAGHRWPR